MKSVHGKPAPIASLLLKSKSRTPKTQGRRTLSGPQNPSSNHELGSGHLVAAAGGAPRGSKPKRPVSCMHASYWASVVTCFCHFFSTDV